MIKKTALYSPQADGGIPKIEISRKVPENSSIGNVSQNTKNNTIKKSFLPEPSNKAGKSSSASSTFQYKVSIK